MREGPYEVEPADHWSDDPWYADQENREFVPNPGYRVVNEGEAAGRLLGGHLGTFCLLFGTAFMPDLEGTILLLECDEETKPEHLDRELQSLIFQPGFEGVRGLVIGRFQRASQMDPDTLNTVVCGKLELSHILVVADASFGHTAPQFTFPIGGRGRLDAQPGAVRVRDRGTLSNRSCARRGFAGVLSDEERRSDQDFIPIQLVSDIMSSCQTSTIPRQSKKAKKNCKSSKRGIATLTYSTA
jgi:hypothetical protein